MPDNHCPHQEHVHLPIGIVKKSTEAGTTIRLIPPHTDDNKLQPQATILTRDSETGAHARAKLDFTHFKRHKRGNLQGDGTERPGVPEYLGQLQTVKNLPAPATGGAATERWHPLLL